MKNEGSTGAAVIARGGIQLPAPPPRRRGGHRSTRETRTCECGYSVTLDAGATMPYHLCLPPAPAVVAAPPAPAPKKATVVNGRRVLLGRRKFDHDAAIAAYVAGASCETIASGIGVQSSVVYRVIRRAGVARTRAEARRLREVGR
jgi:hypothetical protein